MILTVAIRASSKYIIRNSKSIDNGMLIYLFMNILGSVIMFIFCVSLFVKDEVVISLINRKAAGMMIVIGINLILGLNFSFEATLVIYINRISIPPIMIRNRI